MNSIDDSIRLWTGDAELAKVRPRAIAQLDGELAVIKAGAFLLQSDLPVPLGGTDKAVSPIAMLLAALSGCAVVLIRDTLAPQFGVRVEAISVEAKCNADYRGLVGMKGATPEIENLELEITIKSPDGDDKVGALYEAWLERCPVYLALIRPMTVKTKLLMSSATG